MRRKICVPIRDPLHRHNPPQRPQEKRWKQIVLGMVDVANWFRSKAFVSLHAPPTISERGFGKRKNL
jgi:hypothetical protein